MPHPAAHIQEEIDRLKAESGALFGKADVAGAISRLQEAWQLLPEPKTIYDESFHLANYILQMAMQVKDFTTARHWVEVLQHCDPERPNIGEKEFMAGRVAYEAGDLATAQKWLAIANEKSEGLCFQGEDKKYKQLLKQKIN